MKRLLVVTALFGLGTLSQIFLDLWLAATQSKPVVAEWALFKSLIFTAGVLCLLGGDKAAFRAEQITLPFIGRNLSCLFLGALIFAGLVQFSPQVVPSYPALLVGIVLAGLIIFFYESFKGQNFLYNAQWVYSGWKLLLVLCCVLAVGPVLAWPVHVYFMVVASTMLLISAVLQLTRKERLISAPKNPSKQAQDWKLRVIFTAFSVCFVGSIYLDQIMLGLFFPPEVLANYFAHLSIILGPYLLLSSFHSFVYGAWFKSQAMALRRRSAIFGLFATLIIAATASLVIVYLAPYLFAKILHNNYTINRQLMCGLMLIGSLRMLYVIPSSSLTVVGQVSQLSKFLYANIAGIICQIAIFTALAVYLQYDIYLSIVIAVVINWTLRVSGGLWQLQKTPAFHAP